MTPLNGDNMEFIKNILNLYTTIVSSVSFSFSYFIMFVVAILISLMLFKVFRKIIY